MNDERDETIERASRALSALPPVHAGAVARVVMAVRAHRARPAPAWRRAMRWVEDTSVPARVAGLLIAASLVIGFVARGTIGAPDAVVGVAATGVVLEPAANVETRAVPVALALELANAKSVSVVGDFNGWDPAATPMERVGPGGPWSATFLAKPGRHTYAYLVDGTTLMVDPRAPRARSADFDGDASVLMVRTP